MAKGSQASGRLLALYRDWLVGASRMWRRVAWVTTEKHFKRRVRARMRETGERYSSARAAMDARLRVDLKDMPMSTATTGTGQERSGFWWLAHWDDSARRALDLACGAAQRDARGCLDTVHLLEAVGRMGPSDLPFTWEVLRTRLGAPLEEPTHDTSRDSEIPFTPYAKEALASGMTEALVTEGEIGTVTLAHLLAGILDVRDPEVQEVARGIGADLNGWRSTLPRSQWSRGPEDVDAAQGA
jgi:hypothetical protein